MTRARLRQSLLAGLLLLSLAATWWVHQQEESEDADVSSQVASATIPDRIVSPPVSVATATPPNSDNAEQAAPITLDLKRLHARDLAGTDIDPFRTKSWFVPPPPPPPEPSPKPTAPPLPFQFVGKTEEVGGKPAIYLANGNEFYTISVGDKFAGSYQLERIDRGALVIRYLPLSIVQILPIGNSE